MVISKNENFTRNLKTGFLHLFVNEMTPDICKSQHNYNNVMIIGTLINNIN